MLYKQLQCNTLQYFKSKFKKTATVLPNFCWNLVTSVSDLQKALTLLCLETVKSTFYVSCKKNLETKVNKDAVCYKSVLQKSCKLEAFFML